jgi:alkylated DNA nucleotide flippase Atl1
VLDLVERIPPGHVLAYGDIAELLAEGGPRQVGRVMALWGGAVPWWRVVRASGQPALGHEREALERLRTERAPLAGDGSRVDMARARWTAEGEGTAPTTTDDSTGRAVPPPLRPLRPGLSAGSDEMDR